VFTIERLGAAELTHHHADLAALLINVVEGGSSVGFIAPLSEETADAFWGKIGAEVDAGKRLVLAAIEGDSDNQHIVGCVHLALAAPLNGTHRAEVQKLLVHSLHRQKGIATALMTAIEDAARGLGKSLLVLDTESGSTADGLYERWGFVRSGVIPQYAQNSTGTALIDTVIYYKLV